MVCTKQIYRKDLRLGAKYNFMDVYCFFFLQTPARRSWKMESRMRDNCYGAEFQNENKLTRYYNVATSL